MVYFSFISYRVNSFPEDTISVGMIMIDTKTRKFKIQVSDLKMKYAKKMHPRTDLFKFFKNTVDMMLGAKWTYKQLDYSARHQNGLIKISMPSKIACGLESFDQMFYKRIEENFKIS
jgi:hypothetical protein